MTRRPQAKAGMILALACLALAAGLSVRTAGAEDGRAPAPRWIVLPFADYTEDQTGRLLAPLLEAELAARGLDVVGGDQIRPLLRALRIRSSEGLGRNELRRLAGEAEFDALVLGSWDILREGANPEIGLSMRVLDPGSGDIVQAASVGATGDDFTGLLGRGRLRSLDALVRHAMPGFVSELLQAAPGPDGPPTPRGCRRVALIPLDDAVERTPAGPIVLNAVLADLVRTGFEVVEPGFVRELMLEREIAARGGVDLPTSRLLAERFGVCRIVTGEVDRFESAAGDPATTVPAVSFGLRTILPVEGVVDRAWELERTGGESDRLLQRGRIHAMHPLMRTVLKEWTEELDSNAR